ncbi:MAG TPA: hypothetical protein VJ549_07295 [Geothrix sp.]|nr:hypothetical protein [Geothrix sp.]
MGSARRLRLITVAFLLALAWGARPLQAQWSFKVEAGLCADDNAGNAGESDDVVKVTSRFLSLGAFQRTYVSDTFSLGWGGHLRGESFNRATGLDNASLALEAGLRKKWGLGPWVPWTEFTLSSSRDQFHDPARTGWRHRAALTAGRRWTEVVDLSGELWTERRAARAAEPEAAGLSGDVFSQTLSGLRIQADVALDARFTLSLAGLFRTGDVTFNSTGGLDEYPTVRAAALDPVLGPGFFAYRMPGTSRGARAALVIVLTPRLSLNLAGERHLTRLESGETYGRNILSAACRFAF